LTYLVYFSISYSSDHCIFRKPYNNFTFVI